MRLGAGREENSDGPVWGLRRPRSHAPPPGGGREAEGGERERLRQRPVPTPAPVRPGTAASSAVCSSCGSRPGPRGAPPSGITVRARDTPGGGGVVLPLPDPPPTPYTHPSSPESVCGVLSSLRVVFPRVCLSVCPRVYWFPTLSTFQLRSQGSHFVHPLVADPGSFLVRPAF